MDAQVASILYWKNQGESLQALFPLVWRLGWRNLSFKYRITLITRAAAETVNNAYMLRIQASVAVKNAIKENILLNDITWPSLLLFITPPKFWWVESRELSLHCDCLHFFALAPKKTAKYFSKKVECWTCRQNFHWNEQICRASVLSIQRKTHPLRLGVEACFFLFETISCCQASNKNRYHASCY